LLEGGGRDRLLEGGDREHRVGLRRGRDRRRRVLRNVRQGRDRRLGLDIGPGLSGLDHQVRHLRQGRDVGELRRPRRPARRAHCRRRGAGTQARAEVRVAEVLQDVVRRGLRGACGEKARARVVAREALQGLEAVEDLVALPAAHLALAQVELLRRDPEAGRAVLAGGDEHR
jgi:hypothetical protein